MWQAISVWLLFCAEATSSDIGPRLLRQETPQHRFSHSRRHAMQVEGSGAIAPAGSGGLAEAIVRAVNVTNETEGEVSDVTLTARLGFKVPQCKVLLEKARNLLHFHASQLITEGRHHDTVRTLVVVFDALTALQGGNATEQSLEVIQAALGNVTLKTALQAGEVWTASDQGAFFYHCFPGLTPFQELEEHNYHGDIELDTYQEPTVTASHSSPVELHQDQHEVRYCYRIGTNTTAKRAFVAARKHISDQVPCLKFTHILPDIHGKGCSLSPAIEVRDQNSGCWAGYQKEWDGTNTGTIFLNLGRGCEMEGMIVHQLMKILGVRKELTRIDRDRYLNVRTELLREPWMERYFAKRHVPPAPEAYAQDPFDYLSINMYPSTAFTNGSSHVLEPAKDMFMARFLGQRMGLSQLDVEALGDLYGCPATIRPTSPTRVLAQLMLAGKGLRFDGTCRDFPDVQTNLTFLLHQDTQTCAALTSEQCVAHQGVPELCPFSCVQCIPAVADMVTLYNEHFQKEEKPQYCDDTGCHTTDPEGRMCKTANPSAQQTPCEDVDLLQALYCDDSGCKSQDPDGHDCRERNPGASQIKCAVLSEELEVHAEPRKVYEFCADLAVTGIKFKHGPKATCHDLQNYCGHGTLGTQVRQACAATCSEHGYPCTNEAHMTRTDGEGCRDKGKDEKPLLKVHGLARSCEDIRHYCLEHANSTTVQKKCPWTCGACVPGTGYIAVDADEESTAPVDISGTENLTYEDILAKIQWTGDILEVDATAAPSVEDD